MPTPRVLFPEKQKQVTEEITAGKAAEIIKGDKRSPDSNDLLRLNQFAGAEQMVESSVNARDQKQEVNQSQQDCRDGRGGCVGVTKTDWPTDAKQEQWEDCRAGHDHDDQAVAE